jgi:hypothetical protein
MRWSDVTALPTDRQLREFASTAAVLGAGFAAWNVYRGSTLLATICGAMSLLTIIAGLWRPRWLAPFFQMALTVTFPIAWTVSLLLLAVIFFGLLTPLGLALRLFCRDPLDRRLNADQNSYWQSRPPGEQARRYLRQY